MPLSLKESVVRISDFQNAAGALDLTIQFFIMRRANIVVEILKFFCGNIKQLAFKEFL